MIEFIGFRRAIVIEEKNINLKRISMPDYREEHVSMPGSISRSNFYETRRIGYGIKAVAFLHRAISSPTPFHRQFL